MIIFSLTWMRNQLVYDYRIHIIHMWSVVASISCNELNFKVPDHTFLAVLHVSLQVTHQAELHPGWEPGEQLPDWLPVAVSRHSALPVLRLLRGASEAPLLRTPLLQPLL